MNQRLQSISNKLQQLKSLDIHFQLFGAHRHHYQLNPVISLETIQQFEQTHLIGLPEDYVAFLTQLGNGGAGPFYGLEAFERILFVDLDRPNDNNLLYPNLPFPHLVAWNEPFNATCDEDNEAEFEQQYFEFHQHQMDGTIAICNYGCGVSLNLVVNGTEYGHIWTDDRANDGGIYPSQELGNTERLNFLDWYELWLDQSLVEIHEKQVQKEAQIDNLENKQIESHLHDSSKQKAWWKFW